MIFQEYVYALHMTGFDPALTKIGFTRAFEQRLKHHRTSMAGWEVLVLLPLDHGTARQVEKWLKDLYAGYRWKNSPEVFLLPFQERAFLELLAPSFFRYGSHLTMPANDELLAMSIAERFAHIFQQNGHELIDVPQNFPPADEEFWRAVHGLPDVNAVMNYKPSAKNN